MGGQYTGTTEERLERIEDSLAKVVAFIDLIKPLLEKYLKNPLAKVMNRAGSTKSEGWPL